MQTPSGMAGNPLALVTGASSGIGAAFASSLARSGHDVFLVGRNADRLEVNAREFPGKSRIMLADLAQRDGLRIVEEFLRGYDRPVSLLVNNAGVAWYGPFVDHDRELLERTVDVNVTAAMLLTRAALPRMLDAGRGGIINVSSLASRYPQRNIATYVATKAFIDSWTKSLRIELRGSGVSVTCVRPGWVRTNFHAASGEEVERVSAREWLSPSDVADRALIAHSRDEAFLCVPKEPSLARRAKWRAMGWAGAHAPTSIRRLRRALREARHL